MSTETIQEMHRILELQKVVISKMVHQISQLEQIDWIEL